MTHRIRRVLAALNLCAAGAVIACGGDGPSDPNPQTQFGIVQGTVTEEGGAGVVGVQVDLGRSGAQTRTTTTAASGQFMFQQVETGAWTVTVHAPSGFTLSGSGSANVTVTANQTTTAPAVVLQRTQAQLEVQVVMSSTAFVPREARVARGGKVTWTNQDPFDHNTTSTVAGSAWASGNMAQNATFERTFPTAGTFAYTCTLHPGMDGTVVVE
jgi:plastocyanin